MKVLTDTHEAVNVRPRFSHDYIKKIEEFYSDKDEVPVKFVCSTDLNGESFAYDIFYRETPHPEFGNRYFGLFNRASSGSPDIFICNADKVEELEFHMVTNTKNGEYEYSHHRHDMFGVGDVSIDGGRAYLRLVGDIKVEVTTFKMKDGQFVKYTETA